MRWLDALVWSGLWLAAAAAALVAASSCAMGIRPALLPMALATGGTLFVYGTDRVRDRARDRTTAPDRAVFVERHRNALTALAAAGGLAAVASAVAGGPSVAALAALVAALGLLHRRLKRWAAAKPAYLTFAWTAVAVGLPAAFDPAALHRAWAAAVVAPTILANVALSNLRDGEGLAGLFGPARTLRAAAALLVVGAAAALLGPAVVRPLAALPAAMGVAVLRFRSTERYGAVAVDGALLAGALLALALARG